MKKLIYFALTIISLGLTTSCSSDDSTGSLNSKLLPYKETNKETNGEYTVSIQSRGGKFIAPATTPVIIEITDNNDPTNKVFTNTSMSIYMHMSAHPKGGHGAPITQLQPVAGTTNKFIGEVMFTMAGTEPGKNYWTITINTENKGKKSEIVLKPIVNKKATNEYQTLQSFTVGEASNKVTYWMAMHEITAPIVGKNKFDMSIFKSEEGSTKFPNAEDYTVDLDPRMPTMGNHGVGEIIPSLKFDNVTKKYTGYISFNMEGYWFINLLVKDKQGNIVAGKFVEPSSTVNSDKFFEIEL